MKQLAIFGISREAYTFVWHQRQNILTLAFPGIAVITPAGLRFMVASSLPSIQSEAGRVEYSVGHFDRNLGGNVR